MTECHASLLQCSCVTNTIGKVLNLLTISLRSKIQYSSGLAALNCFWGYSCSSLDFHARQWLVSKSVFSSTLLRFLTDFSESQENVEESLTECGCSRVYCPRLSSCSRSELVLSTRLCGTVPTSRVRAHIPSSVNVPQDDPADLRFGREQLKHVGSSAEKDSFSVVARKGFSTSFVTSRPCS